MKQFFRKIANFFKPTPKALRLAFDYYNDKDYVDAAELFTELSEQGNDIAQAALAYLYMEGKGVDENIPEALRLSKLAAEQGNRDGQFYLGLIYLRELGFGQDDSEALHWLHKAAKQGHPGIKEVLETHQKRMELCQEYDRVLENAGLKNKKNKKKKRN